jgi:TRAP-type C4-dicarboxylate transport system permease small subunit
MSLDKLSGVIFSFWAGLVFCLLFAFGGNEIVRIAADDWSAVEFFHLFFGWYGGFWTGSLCFMVFVLTVILFKDLPIGIEQDLPEITGHEE